MSYATAADELGHSMHGAISGLVNAAVTSLAMNRQMSAARNEAAYAAADGARIGVLRSTVDQMRRKSADDRASARDDLLAVQDEAAFWRSEYEAMKARAIAAEAVVEQRARQVRVLADALRSERLVAA